jgi:hypothetical protein
MGVYEEGNEEDQRHWQRKDWIKKKLMEREK